MSAASKGGVFAAPEICKVDTPAGVAEFQGMYGPFSFSEKLFQKIWRHGNFDVASARIGGVPLRVLHPGKWNLLGGPDFKGARLLLGTEERVGDVELHLHARDWDAHRHAADPAYARVVLHVVLFPPPAGHVTRGADGREIPTLALLPLLRHDLEEYAAEEAVARLADRPETFVFGELAALDPTALAARIRLEAGQRWRQKLGFARRRVEVLGWTGACHHAALEILGFRFNRAPMLRVASAFPAEAWAAGAVDLEAVFAGGREHWSLQGVRPANHPRVRLGQYAEWMRRVPAWPATLERLAAALPSAMAAAGIATPDFRRRHGLAALRRGWNEAVCGGAVAGTRFDNLCCDGFLPLLAARGGRDHAELWWHWFAGDVPPAMRAALRDLGLAAPPLAPLCHGHAQGLLGWMIRRTAGAG